MTSAYSINLNFNNTIPVKTDFTFKQGDKGITLNLATTGLDPAGTTAHIVFKRSNGTSVEAELTGQTGPNYSYTTLGNEFEIPGVVVADLKLYNGDTQRVSTASFIFLVTGDTMDGVGGGTGGYSDQLEELSQEFSDTLEEYKDAFGDVGAVNPRGAYDSTADYNVLDLVSYQGSSYLCRTACKNKVPTNTTYWQVFASGAQGVDYGDLTGKPSINNVTLSGNKTTADLGLFSGNYNDLTNKPTIPSNFDDLADVDMTGVTDGQVPTWDATAQKYKPGTGGGGTNLNLLINPWFTVNQRRQSAYSSNGYSVDHWACSFGGSKTISLNGVASLTNPAWFYQPIENNLPAGDITISAKIDGTIYSYTFQNINDGSTHTHNSGDLVDYIQIQFTERDANLGGKDGFAFKLTSASSNHTITAAKLEIGSVSTLHLDTAPDYTTELLKCQRYFYRIYADVQYLPMANVSTESALARGVITLPTEMRDAPTISSGGTMVISAAGTTYSITSISLSNASKSIANVRFYANNLVAGLYGIIMAMSVGAYIDFSAEL